MTDPIPRVLVVDDSDVTRAILARTLRGAGFDVLEARDGAEGALTAFRELPSVVVTDLEMPTMDGFPLLRLLKADPWSAHIPVLILTSHSEAASRYWSLHTGADAYLTKDHGPQELIATVRRLVEEAAAAPQAADVRAPETGAGTLAVLARVARQLDASLLQATVVNTLLERGMATGDFHDAGRVALQVLGEIVDARFLAVAVAEPGAALLEILLQDPLAPVDVEAIHDLLVRRLSLPPGAGVDARVIGDTGRERIFDLDRIIWLPLSLRGAEGGVALLPRDPSERQLASAGLLDGLVRPLTLILDNARLSQRLHEMSTVDGLTRQLNHRAIYERLTEELERARRYNYPLTVILCDIDHFKEVNDKHGHLAGDAVLREGASVLRRCLRTTDILGRYGGEEFLAVLPQVDLEAGQKAAERLRQGLEAHWATVQSGENVRITGSFGVASRDELTPPATVDLLVSLADRRLYEAKAAGRNLVR
jgi:two-component system cell cycle response regulator